MIKSDQLIRVMLADDHRVLIGSLRALLERHGCEIAGEATTGEEALAVAARVRPQVIVMDLEMPGTGGLAAAHRMKQAAPAAKVLILSAHDDESDVLEALNEAQRPPTPDWRATRPKSWSALCALSPAASAI